jgi:hypothetical protein
MISTIASVLALLVGVLGLPTLWRAILRTVILKHRPRSRASTGVDGSRQDRRASKTLAA